MTLLLSRQIDVAEAMIYNEYAQVLEATTRDRSALSADRPERHRLQPGRDGDAPGRDLLARVVARAAGQRGHRRRASCAPHSRAGSTAATTLRTASSTRSTRARRWGRPPGLDDERDQSAGLAVAQRHRQMPVIVEPDRGSRQGCRHHHGRSDPGAYRTDLADRPADRHQR